MYAYVMAFVTFYMTKKLPTTLRNPFTSSTFKWKTTQQHLINFMFFVLAKIILTDDMMSKHEAEMNARLILAMALS